MMNGRINKRKWDTQQYQEVKKKDEKDKTMRKKEKEFKKKEKKGR